MSTAFTTLFTGLHIPLFRKPTPPLFLSAASHPSRPCPAVSGRATDRFSPRRRRTRG